VVQEMRQDDLLRASSPLLTRLLVNMLRDGDMGKVLKYLKSAP